MKGRIKPNNYVEEMGYLCRRVRKLLLGPFARAPSPLFESLAKGNGNVYGKLTSVAISGCCESILQSTLAKSQTCVEEIM